MALANVADLVTRTQHGSRSEYEWTDDSKRRAELGFAVRYIPGKGLGAVALRAFRKGHKLLEEAPLVSGPPSDCSMAPEHASEVESLVGGMSPPDRAQYDSLAHSAKYGPRSTAAGIWLTNALPSSLDSSSAYADCCRFNHSCSPNVHHAFDARGRRQTLRLLVDVQAGDELVICYRTGAHGARALRQATLLENFGFECRCVRCGG